MQMKHFIKMDDATWYRRFSIGIEFAYVEITRHIACMYNEIEKLWST